jgi:hypothetical protein
VRFFQGVANTYQGEGTTGGTMHDLEVVPIGERSALAIVTWKNRRPDGSVARQWRQSYNVVRFDECYSACNIDPLSRGIGVQN